MKTIKLRRNTWLFLNFCYLLQDKSLTKFGLNDLKPHLAFEVHRFMKEYIDNFEIIDSEREICTKVSNELHAYLCSIKEHFLVPIHKISYSMLYSHIYRYKHGGATNTL